MDKGNGRYTLNDLENECLSQMLHDGIPFQGPMVKDGELHRFTRDQKREKDEWYFAFEGVSIRGTPYLNCAYGSWSDGSSFKYSSWEHKSASYSESELQTIREEWLRRQKEIELKIEEDKKKRAENARTLWDQASPTSTHPDHEAYLIKKSVKAHGVRYSKDDYGNPVLVVPICNGTGEVCGVQYIGADGTKIIYGLKQGNYHQIGEIKANSLIYVSEGYATGSSVYEASGWPTIVAFDCHNIDPVVRNLKKLYPRHHIVIAADDDHNTSGNPGKTKALAAAKKHQCKVILPIFPDDQKFKEEMPLTDFNDLRINFGVEAAKKQLSRKPHLKPIDIQTFLSLEIPPKKLLLSPWLPEQGLTMIYALRGVGKTYVSLSIAYAVATGGTIFGWQASEPKRVLYVDGEMPSSTMQERLAQISRSSERHLLDSAYFRLITPDLQEAGIRDLCTSEGQADIIEYMDDFDLIVFDNLSTLTRSGKENDAESWLPVQELALFLRRMGKSVLFVHHAAKAGQQRGTSRKEDVLDTVINLRRPPKYSPSDGAKFEVHFEKNRSFGGDDAKPFEAALTSNESKLIWSCRDIENRNDEDIIDMYNEGVKQADIAKELDVHKSTICRVIKKAKAEGKIKK
ncbi:MAG: AAA family ATPase [Parachlamydiaceae bacterium]